VSFRADVVVLDRTLHYFVLLLFPPPPSVSLLELRKKKIQVKKTFWMKSGSEKENEKEKISTGERKSFPKICENRQRGRCTCSYIGSLI